MTKKVLFAACVGVLAAVSAGALFENGTNQGSTHLFLDDVEALSSCESVGWWDNNGNCVKNNKGEYFCKTDTWYELTDCVM